MIGITLDKSSSKKIVENFEKSIGKYFFSRMLPRNLFSKIWQASNFSRAIQGEFPTGSQKFCKSFPNVLLMFSCWFFWNTRCFRMISGSIWGCPYYNTRTTIPETGLVYLTIFGHHYIFIISWLWLTSHPRSTVVLLDTGTLGTSREIYRHPHCKFLYWYQEFQRG